MATEIEAWTTGPQNDGVFSVEKEQDEENGSFGSDDLNELEVNGNWTPQEKALHEARLKAKAKRRLRKSSSRDSNRESFSDSVSGELSTDPNSPKGKNAVNDRKSRTGKGRGLPKKGGAGGKGVWGAAGLVYEVEEPDARDPNYDESSQGDTVYATVVPELDERELEKTINPIVQEYFEHGDTKEVEMLLKELNLGHHKFEFSSLAVSLSLEGKASHRELTSRLLSDLSGKVLSEKDMSRAFDKILKELPDLILDTPEAPQVRLKCHSVNPIILKYALTLIPIIGLTLGQHIFNIKVVVMVLESTGDTALQMMVKLLKAFWQTGLITLDQMNRGFQRVYDELPEINLDVPHAQSIMETFVDLCYQESVITKHLRDSCPTRGRKRFVSEGDGGIVKS
ncbi:programmed cell death protein 4a [Garra rufa]|uniref:programmed cell death protein 4a n=1 Tax=Garra rufa TaxID=137080 RepID=UPI003CCE82E3